MAHWIEKLWFESPPSRYLIAPLFWPLSKLFAVIAKRRRRYFLTYPAHVYRAPVPVIIVGNITVGGNGKTPIVVWLVESLKRMGMNPGVVSRGYGGCAREFPLQVQSDTTPAQAGDEPVLIYQRTGVPVMIDPDRSAAVKALLPLGVDIVIADDGLQHYKLARDIELVIIDGERRLGNGHYLPYGPLRESIERLATVDFVLCNGGQPQAGERGFKLAPQPFVHLQTGERKTLTSSDAVVAMAAIGNPQRFFSTLQQLGVNPLQCHAFADHQALSLDALCALASPEQLLVMTEKDAVKCRPLLGEMKTLPNWWYLPVNAEFARSDAACILNKIKHCKDGYGSSTI